MRTAHLVLGAQHEKRQEWNHAGNNQRSPHRSNTAHQIGRPGWGFLQPNFGNFFGGMHVVGKVSGALLNFLNPPAKWLDGLLNLRGVHRDFFGKGQRPSVKLVTQQADEAHACEHNNRRGQAARQMQLLEQDYNGVKQDC